MRAGNDHTPCVHEDKLPRVARIARNDENTQNIEAQFCPQPIQENM